MKNSNLSVCESAYERQRKIENTLYFMLKKKPYRDISITELCKEAGVSRRIFYHYYQDKEACICAGIDRFFHLYMLEATEAMATGQDALTVCTRMVEFWKEKRIFLDIISRNNLIHLVMYRGIRIVEEESFSLMIPQSTEDVETDRDILASHIGAFLSLMLRWRMRGFADPANDMARKYLRIIRDPIHGSWGRLDSETPQF